MGWGSREAIRSRGKEDLMRFDFVAMPQRIPVGIHKELVDRKVVRATPAGGVEVVIVGTDLVDVVDYEDGFHLAAVNRRADAQLAYTGLAILGAKDSYQTLRLCTLTALHATDDAWTFCAQGSDLVGIKKAGTESGMTELHVLRHDSVYEPGEWLDPATGRFTAQPARFYQAFQLQASTALHETDSTWAFAMLGSDLLGVKKSGTQSGMTEVHILRGDDGYRSFLLQAPTALHPTDEAWAFAALGRDLVCIKKSGTESGTTEVHILSAATNYSTFRMQTRTPLHETDASWSFVMHDRDLLGIKKSGTESGMTEVHILRGDDGYQTFLLQVPTALHQTD
jgi:hypothetical protein